VCAVATVGEYRPGESHIDEPRGYLARFVDRQHVALKLIADIDPAPQSRQLHIPGSEEGTRECNDGGPDGNEVFRFHMRDPSEMNS